MERLRSSALACLVLLIATSSCTTVSEKTSSNERTVSNTDSTLTIAFAIPKAQFDHRSLQYLVPDTEPGRFPHGPVRKTASSTSTTATREPKAGHWAPFHVVLTNRSNQPLKLWKEWNSWGYYCLSFEIQDPQGRATNVAKGGMAWGRNFPDDIVLPPGESWVWDVQWDDKVWNNLPKPSDAGKGGNHVKMRAVFEIKPDEESKEHGVWTGKIHSEWQNFNLWR